MKIGIVGSEGAKFTPETEEKARERIRGIIKNRWTHPSLGLWVISGACHLGGIDIWAIEEAKKLGCHVLEFPPESLSWEGGYKRRNLQIADASDEVYCITVKTLPPGYKGMRFSHCYHCDTKDHVKSGGCWTVKQARKMGKPGFVLVIE